jgi:hypothetical protein
MKRHILILLLLAAGNLTAQSAAETAVRQTIDRFFEGYHSRDTTVMSSTLQAGAILQSIGEMPDGKPVLHDEPIKGFLEKVASIPDTVQLEERLLDYRIQIDGNMASAWTPYEFYLRYAFHHCGVNSFQLFNDGSAWKIIYIADTRRTAGCGKD